MPEEVKSKEERILFIGASGSGTSTLGKLLSEKIKVPHFDLDVFFWKSTKIPYTEFRTKDELLKLVQKDLYSQRAWIISGDPSEWGISVEKYLTKIYFLDCPTELRVERLNERESKKQGKKILDGGANYENHKNFIKWTKKYEDGGISGRSRKKQERWLESLNSEVFRLNTDRSPEDLIQEILTTFQK